MDGVLADIQSRRDSVVTEESRDQFPVDMTTMGFGIVIFERPEKGPALRRAGP